MDDINLTASISPRDYAMVLVHLNDDSLLNSAQTNHWLMEHIQMSDVDFRARYDACQLEIHKRNLILDYAPLLC